MSSDGLGRPRQPRRRWWQVGTSVGQTLLLMGLPLLAIPGLISGWSKLFFWMQLGLVLLYLGVTVCGIATIVALRRHPELKLATPRQWPIDRSTRRRYSVATLVGSGLAVLSFVVAVLVQTSLAWMAFAVIVVLTFLCLAQVGRPLIVRDPATELVDQPPSP